MGTSQVMWGDVQHMAVGSLAGTLRCPVRGSCAGFALWAGLGQPCGGRGGLRT